jgi:hypothetical protein
MSSLLFFLIVYLQPYFIKAILGKNHFRPYVKNYLLHHFIKWEESVWQSGKQNLMQLRNTQKHPVKIDKKENFLLNSHRGRKLLREQTEIQN